MEEQDPRIGQAIQAIEQIGEAVDCLQAARALGKDIIGKTLWKRIDKELGVLQTLEHDLNEWKIKNIGYDY